VEDYLDSVWELQE
jgi:hypothetical protein